MGKRLFVGGLPFDTTEQALQELFQGVGPVENVKIIIDKQTGRSKGFGFVEMANDADAQSAIQKLNGSAMGQRKISVSEARPMEKREEGGGGRGGYGGGGRGRY